MSLLARNKGLSFKCQAPGCGWASEGNLIMCLNHWRRLPSSMQGDVLSASTEHRKNNPLRRTLTRAELMTKDDFLESSANAVEYLARLDSKSLENIFRTTLRARQEERKRLAVQEAQKPSISETAEPALL